MLAEMMGVDYWPLWVSAQLANQSPNHSAVARSKSRLPVAREKVLVPLRSRWAAEPCTFGTIPSWSPLKGSHQAWGLRVNEPGMKSRACAEGWPETGLGTERTEAQWASVHPQAARAWPWRGVLLSFQT